MVKISKRIILSYLITILIGFGFFVERITKDLKPRYREAVEESLVDQVYLLSEIISNQSTENNINLDFLTQPISKANSNKINAKIYQLTKKRVDLRIYVTDKKGIVAFDSYDKTNIGKDFSKWNDVLLALKGDYGSRTTRDRPNDPTSSVLYSAAPIFNGRNIIGSVTLAKPTKYTNTFIKATESKLLSLVFLTALGIVIFASLLTKWINKPIDKLNLYLEGIKTDNEMELPELGKNEIGEIGERIKEMKDALDSKDYIEKYIQNLTHEIKSPLSVIKGSSELIQEDEENEGKLKLISNISEESSRIDKLVNKMLDLSSLENKDKLSSVSKINLNELLKATCEDISPIYERKQISIKYNLSDSNFIKGDDFLVTQAIRNVLLNSIEFSPNNSQIYLSVHQSKNKHILKINDNGKGIPNWAQDKVFDRFFSLPRPNSNKKSTGLGLSFVKKIMELHEGRIDIVSNENGTTVSLSFPAIVSL